MSDTIKGRIFLANSTQVWVEGEREELASLTRTLARCTGQHAELNIALRDGGQLYRWSHISGGWAWLEREQQPPGG